MRKKTSITAVAGTVLILMVLALASCTGKSGKVSVGGSSAGAAAAGTKKITISASAVSSSAFIRSSIESANTHASISDPFFAKLDSQAKNLPPRTQSSSSIDPDLGQGKGRSSNITVGQGSGFSSNSTINGSTSLGATSSSVPFASFPGTENTSENDNLVFGSDCPMPSIAASLCGRDSFSYGAMVGGACPTFVCVIGLGTGDQADGILGN